jgi:hypothetical protein
MPGFVIRNEVRRDELVKFAYPFDEVSTLKTDEVTIGMDLVLDAMLFPKTPAQAPLRIDQIDGTAEPPQFRLLIKDARNMLVGTATVNLAPETVQVLSPAGALVGLLVLNEEAVARFAGAVTGRTFQLQSNTAVFCLDVTHVTQVRYLRWLQVQDLLLTGTVNIVARHGCRWAAENTGIRLDVFASYPQTSGGAAGVRSVNGVANQSIWLANHPQLNLRIDSRGNKLTFRHVRDETR